jgi:hypothetical protein
MIADQSLTDQPARQLSGRWQIFARQRSRMLLVGACESDNDVAQKVAASFSAWQRTQSAAGGCLLKEQTIGSQIAASD